MGFKLALNFHTGYEGLFYTILKGLFQIQIE